MDQKFRCDCGREVQVYQDFPTLSWCHLTLVLAVGCTAEANSKKEFGQQNKLFLEAISSFSTLSQCEIEGQPPSKIKWLKATEASNYEAIAYQAIVKSLKLGRYGVDEFGMHKSDCETDTA